MEREATSEKAESDPRTEPTGQGGETGLEEPMWQLSLVGGGGGGSSGTGGGGGVGIGGWFYPERPGEPDCIYYLRTGFCGYGARCRFNHPRDVELVPGGGRASVGEGEYPERPGQPVCQYYMRTGACKFGSSCKYHHPRHGIGSPTAVALNIYGYPLRLGEKECSYYMKTGQCKFGMTCKFHHPLPQNLQVPMAAAVAPPTASAGPMVYPQAQSPAATPTQQYGVMGGGNWPVVRPHSMVPGSYVQGPYGTMLLPTGVVPISGWTPYPGSVSAVAVPSSQSSVGSSQLFGIPPPYPMSFPYASGPYPSPVASAGPSSSIQKEQSYPERPGQPECQHYLKTGECKFGPSCRYHHPADLSARRTSSVDNIMNLPLRPDAPICTHFLQHGVCKFGSSCRFNHSVGSLSYSPSGSSLSDMPVAPYPLGSSIPTLAPSTSSSDLQVEQYSGGFIIDKDSSARISSSSISNTDSSALPKSGSIPQSSASRASSS